MRIRDPRLWALQHPWWVLLVFFLLTGLFAWGNTRLRKGGILDDDVILRLDDPVRLMDRYVQAKQHEGFEGKEAIPLVFNSELRTPEDLLAVARFSDATKTAFGDGLLSLAEAPAYQDTGEALRDDAYITSTEVTQPGFNLNAWKDKVTRDPSVYGLLVGRDFHWTTVIRYLPPGYDEITEFRKTVEFLEGRVIPWWEWLWKRDITPQDPRIGVGGWVMGRGLIDQGMNVDMLSLVNLGVLLTLPVFWVTFGSLHAALLSVAVMLMGGFLWTRGAMGLLPDMHERVYSLLVYANIIVQGTSFALHKSEAFRESRAREALTGWQAARAVDGLIATTAAISLFGFATLWSFGLKPVRELGVASVLGILWLLILAVFFLPAVQMIGGARPAMLDDSQPGWFARAYTHGVEKLVSGCSNTAVWLAAGFRPWIMVTTVCSMFLCVAFLFAQGSIHSRTRSLEFLRGTLVDKEAQFLNQPGNVGFEFLDLLVEPAQGGGIYNPHFLARAWEFQTALKEVNQARETTSILSTIQQLARESFKKPFPETADEVEAAFFLIDNRLAPAVQRQLYFPGGVRMSVSYGEDDSVAFGRFCTEVLTLARTRFPDLKVSPFGKTPLFPQVDAYVRTGKISNVFTSQIGVAMICGVLIAWRNRRVRGMWLSPWRGGLVMSLPLFFATAVMGLIMWRLDIAVDMSTAVITALAINAATDFSLYLAMTYQSLLSVRSPFEALAEALSQQGRVIVADCVLNTLCFLPLVTSRFLPVRQIGWMMAVMLMACAVGTLVFMAALLPRCVAATRTVSERESDQLEHLSAPSA